MSDLPRSALSRTPLFVLSVALAVGMLCARLLANQPRLILILGAAFSAALSLASVLLLRQRKTMAATACITAAFLLTGLSLGIADKIASPQNRLSRFYEQGIIAPHDPIELSVTIDGPLENAPDQLFLRVRANKFRFKQTEYDCSGTVLLTAHVADEE